MSEPLYIDQLEARIAELIERIGEDAIGIEFLRQRITELETIVHPHFIFDWDAIYHEYEWAVVETLECHRYYQVHAHLYEPQWDKRSASWQSDGDFEHVYLLLDLPLGLDYRTLKAKRST